MFRKRKPSEGLKQARKEVKTSEKLLAEANEISRHLQQIAKENHFAEMIVASLDKGTK